MLRNPTAIRAVMRPKRSRWRRLFQWLFLVFAAAVFADGLYRGPW